MIAVLSILLKKNISGTNLMHLYDKIIELEF